MYMCESGEKLCELKNQSRKKEIVDQLYWDGRIDASDVKVEVDGSKVKLMGTVPNLHASYAAVVDAYTVEGVKQVENYIDVKPSTTITIPTDDEIEARVKNSLLWNPVIDSTEIDVSVSGGVVEIEGSVDAYWKKLRAENILSNITGVISVTNKLAVVPTESYVDKDIAHDVVKAVERRYDVSVEDIDVQVDKGTVKLTGTVPDWFAYRAIMDSAENTLGVIDVEDNLVIE